MRRTRFKALALLALVAIPIALLAQTREATTLSMKSGGKSQAGDLCSRWSVTGDPEGAVTGKPCDEVLSTNGHTYQKAFGSGTDMTGWVLKATATTAAPTDVTYITQTCSSSLSAEQCLSVLASGIMRVAATTGAVTALTDSAGIAANISDETGTGVMVFATSPALTTPNLGTPSAVTLTNGTGLPIGSGVSGLGSNVATFLGTASSANLATALTDETGSGAAVFATSPTLVTPALGTPTAIVLDVETAGITITDTQKLIFVVGACQGTSANGGLSLPTSNPAVFACATGTNSTMGVAQFADGSNLSMQGHFPLPEDWTGAIDVKIKWRAAPTSGDVKFQIATICVGDGETVDPAFNTASTVTDTAKGTTLQLNHASISGITVTGCAADEELQFKVFRDSADGADTMAGTAEVIALMFTIRRAK